MSLKAAIFSCPQRFLPGSGLTHPLGTRRFQPFLPVFDRPGKSHPFMAHPLLNWRGNADTPIAAMSTVVSSTEDLLLQALESCRQQVERADFAGALQALNRAVALAPESAEILCHRGRLELCLKDWEAARRDFSSALKLDPQCAAAFSGLARFYFNSGDTMKAEFNAYRAIGLNPADQDAAAILRSLKSKVPVRVTPPANGHRVQSSNGSGAGESPFTAPRPDLISIYRCDPTNVGDFHSAPLHYFDFGTSRFVDIFNVRDGASLPRSLIIGGGGLLGSQTFDPHFQKLFQRSYRQVVGWGLGDNSRVDTASGFVEQTDLRYPAYAERFTLLGVRDCGADYPWVPCASCLHPLFGREWTVENEVVIFEHKRVPIPIDGFPKMNNDTNDLERVLRFLGTARVVITNSYHGVYWSQLLGKGVLAFPFSSKFYHFKHKVTLCKPAEWRKCLARVEEQPPALQECIDANLSFWTKVRQQLNLNTSEVNGRKHADLRPVSSCQEVHVGTPLADKQINILVASLKPRDVVVIADSEDPRFDPLKLRLFEIGHVGRDPATQKQVWKGVKEQVPSCPTVSPGQSLPVIINYYTTGTGYAAAAERLAASCQKLGLPHVIEGISSQGSWESNCAYKPRFILRKWRELKAPVLWLDADAVVRRVPGLLAGLEADFAIHKVDRWQFASGTVFFNQTELALRLLENWVKRCEASPHIWDQENLDAAWQEVSDAAPLKTFWLPQSYTRIFDRPTLPGEDCLPVIEHFQASRALKKTISDVPPTPIRRFPPGFVAARSVSRPFRQPGPVSSPTGQLDSSSATVTTQKICLATNYLLMTAATRQMWADLGKHLAENDCQLVLLSTTVPEPALPFPVYPHPYLMRDFASAYPAAAVKDGLSASPRELEWLQADISRVPGGYPLGEAMTGLAAFRAYTQSLLEALQPGFVLIADNTLCQTALLQKVCLDVGIPVQIYERGLLPETLMLESRGIQAWSDMRTHWLAQELPAAAGDAAAYERIRSYYLARKPQKYTQPDFAGGGSDLRCRLGLEGKKIVVFLGGGYEANGHAPKGGIYERHYYAGFPTTKEALVALWEVVKNMSNVALVFKPHPLDPQTYSAATNGAVPILRDVNVHALIDAADVVAAQYTTLQFEAALYDKPILLLARSAWWGRNAAYEVGSPDELGKRVEEALGRRDWPARSANARAFCTWMMEHVLIGCTGDVPARRNLRDLARFISRVGVDGRGLASAADRCRRAERALERLQTRPGSSEEAAT